MLSREVPLGLVRWSCVDKRVDKRSSSCLQSGTSISAACRPGWVDHHGCRGDHCWPSSSWSGGWRDDRELLDELANVWLRETSPGVFRLDHDPGRHDDRAITLALAAHSLTEKAPSGVGRAYGTQIAAARLPRVVGGGRFGSLEAR